MQHSAAAEPADASHEAGEASCDVTERILLQNEDDREAAKVIPVFRYPFSLWMARLQVTLMLKPVLFYFVPESNSASYCSCYMVQSDKKLVIAEFACHVHHRKSVH